MPNQEGEGPLQRALSIRAASSKVEIVVHDVIENGVTGRVSLSIKSRRTKPDGTIQEGPVKVYGIDSDSLKYIHGGSIDSFLQWVKREHAMHSVQSSDISEQVHALKGKIL